MDVQAAPGAGIGPGAPWWAIAPLSAAAAHPGVKLLPEELARARGYAAGRPREDFVAGRILARVLAAELLGLAGVQGRDVLPGDLQLAQWCPQCASTAHGAPRLCLPHRGDRYALSYARTAGWLLLGLAPGRGRLGVDLADSADAAFGPGDGNLLEDYAYAPGERTRLRALPGPARQQLRARWWALKEAVAKAAGEGLAGEGGIPVVAGEHRHPLLRAAGTRVLEPLPGTPDSLGRTLPGTLVAGIVWVP
ncbi:hypothetical protein DQ353_11745 [Arthrobacter sp. AQ5-05]|uniref:4'-phosphopantetheinyl transferase family protein n=1 Tax=Arthrobacter sp. AQ5-05 TaxID=2184581 RepID=UPI000DCBC24E|nr:4'-phosphopantetheinyl transferase superfamily protein [Arthrobacter sp. AQ5-05]RAX48998.1 hypothetical protein DQ353_11745 [Arthrobacter sp. AQ5-05]